MGGSEEKREVESLHKVKGNLFQKSDISLEQNIFVCGYYNLEFFEKNIISGLINLRKDINNTYDKMAKHKIINDWQFSFVLKIYNFDKMLIKVKVQLKMKNL